MVRFHHSSYRRYMTLYLSSSEMIEVEYGSKTSWEINKGEFISTYNFHIGIMIRGVMAKFGFSITNYRREKKNV